MPTIKAAHDLMRLGYDVIPVGAVDSTGEFNPKNPGIHTDWINRRWDEKTIEQALLTDNRRGIGIRLSLSSVIDVESDTKEADDEARKLFANSLTSSWKSIGANGHFPGRHRLYQLTPSQIEWLHENQREGGFKSLGGVEVRCTGQSVVPPSGGREWVGAVQRAEDVSYMPQDAFAALTAGLKRKKWEVTEAQADTPGADFCIRGDWREVLEPHGWTFRDSKHVCRPGKSGAVSGTVGHCESEVRGELLYIFSDSPEVAPLESHNTYSKFEAFAVLNHDGDFSAAARELRKNGYGFQNSAESMFDVIEEEETPEQVRDNKKPDKPEFAQLSDEYYDNLIGEYCLKLREVSNIDIQAVYYQALEMFGALVGRNAWYTYNTSTRFIADYLILSGDTGAGKGTTFDLAKALFKPQSSFDLFAQLTHTEQAYMALNAGRFGSAEGLITELAARKPDFDSNGLVLGSQYWGALLITDQEASAAFVKMFYDGSTINECLRQAWDSNMISNRTKASKLCAPNPLIGLIWHITPQDLDSLPNSLLHTGFVNRMKLLHCQKPDKSPRVRAGVDVSYFKGKINEILSGIGSQGASEVAFDPEATEFLETVMEKQHRLSGNVAKTHERYTAHVERMACRLALLEGRRIVGIKEAETAEVMQRVVFEHTESLIGSLRGSDANVCFKQKLLEFIQSVESYVSLWEINRHVCGNSSGLLPRRDRAIEELVREGKIGTEIRKGKSGRPARLFIAR